MSSSSPPRPYDAQADVIEAGRKMKDPTSTLFKFYTFVYSFKRQERDPTSRLFRFNTFVYSFSSYCWLLSFSILLLIPTIPFTLKIALGSLLVFLGVQTTRMLRSRLKEMRDAQRDWQGRTRGRDEEQSLMGGAELGSRKSVDVLEEV